VVSRNTVVIGDGCVNEKMRFQVELLGGTESTVNGKAVLALAE